jgi:hypothetical protein
VFVTSNSTCFSPWLLLSFLSAPSEMSNLPQPGTPPSPPDRHSAFTLRQTWVFALPEFLFIGGMINDGGSRTTFVATSAIQVTKDDFFFKNHIGM